ncbi:uncharacterized protein FMAN_06686 [Fusarium mangiferae]|uniref:Uncharacterized protein n=1 Tax=Fusarium mangiferae TaxID=192010 RepID=A0A1L7SRV5_FUSMA|nr:uncharacterized protein FMAN_06686 [Fusarium mangiferae]CVK85782.1 uncharacterized protein FMAN_06686 [Fusarium mangiferae]
MHFLRKTILALGLLGSLTSASPTPSLTTSVISRTSIAPLATSQAALNATKIVRRLEYKNAIPVPERDEDDHCVGHTKNISALSRQEYLAFELVPTSWKCPDPSICREDMRYLTPRVHEAVQNVLVSMKQINTQPITIQVTITNNGTGPITFWKDLSPIGKHAFGLGYFHFHTETEGVVFGERFLADAHGYRPGCYSDLFELKPGQRVSRVIKMPNRPHSNEGKAWNDMLDLASNVTVSMSGNRYGIWAGTKDEVMATDMDCDSFGFNFWNDLIIPWVATFPKEFQTFSEKTGLAMKLYV